MRDWAAGFIGLAMAAALGEVLISDRSARQIARIAAAAGMIVMILSPVLQIDYATYASALREYAETDVWDKEAAEERDRNLNRRLIEESCATYILDKGASMHVQIRSVEVTARWDTNGYWVPEHATICLAPGEAFHAALCDLIVSDLGIPEEEQDWRTADEA